jgi:DNA-binding transcriptional ArsR family regulator
MNNHLGTTELIGVFKALVSIRRFDILALLKDPLTNFPGQSPEQGVSVRSIMNKTGLTQGTISEYMTLLQRSGLVTSIRKGQFTFYKRNEEFIKALGNTILKEL